MLAYFVLFHFEGHLDMVRFLLEAGADQEHKTDEMHTALMEACMVNSLYLYFFPLGGRGIEEMIKWRGPLLTKWFRSAIECFNCYYKKVFSIVNTGNFLV